MSGTCTDPAGFRHNPVYVLWLCIVLLSALLQLVDLQEVLPYDRARIADGAWWLLMSGHFVHAGWSHWALNMAGLALVAVFFSHYGSTVDWILALLAAALSAAVGSFLFDPELERAVGLSAVLHGLFAFGALHEVRRHRSSGVVLLTLLAVKLLWEFFRGAMPGTASLAGGEIATAAHLYGALGGCCAAVLPCLVRRCGTITRRGSR